MEYTIFQLGGPCPFLIECATPQQLKQVVAKFSENKLFFIVVGEGSNLLVSDQGVDCTIVRYFSSKPQIEQEDNIITVSASTRADDLALFAVQKGLAGLNCITGIPGTVGGAVVGNAGAFGKQISECITSVSVLVPNGEVIDEEPRALDFRYRFSRFKETQEVISEVKFSLSKGDRDSLLKKRDEILLSRKDKHPDYRKDPCAGSFFKNVEPVAPEEKRQAAGWFLDQVGSKKMSIGGAGVFEKHANIIIKKDKSCTAQDVYQLSREMFKAVFDKFSLKLEREVRLMGNFEGDTDDRIIR
ncbi:MAG: UDP-N-acetylmuramate dehydrogenase [Candidatus Aceula meridiana]|nr:UDP-N-acetylmuramate dehydrogenase [Candidatus Aceula meridiana]